MSIKKLDFDFIDCIFKLVMSKSALSFAFSTNSIYSCWCVFEEDLPMAESTLDLADTVHSV